ncbi:MAG: DUF2127 domain-containing protein [Candidatus Buchananbacteria bacterium]
MFKYLANKLNKILTHAFNIVVAIKGIDGLLELIIGLTLLLIKTTTLDYLVITLTQPELLHDPNDIFSNYLLNSANSLSVSTQHFIGIYLLLNGLIKIILVYSLLKNKRWAYPFAIVFLGFFIIFQILKLASSFSIILLALTLLDIIIIALAIHEYKRLIKKSL